jgi:hypothetical protein
MVWSTPPKSLTELWQAQWQGVPLEYQPGLPPQFTYPRAQYAMDAKDVYPDVDFTKVEDPGLITATSSSATGAAGAASGGAAKGGAAPAPGKYRHPHWSGQTRSAMVCFYHISFANLIRMSDWFAVLRPTRRKDLRRFSLRVPADPSSEVRKSTLLSNNINKHSRNNDCHLERLLLSSDYHLVRHPLAVFLQQVMQSRLPRTEPDVSERRPIEAKMALVARMEVLMMMETMTSRQLKTK